MKMDLAADLSFGEWLKRRRRSLGFTQEQLAQQLNCSTIMLRKIEAEERRPSAQMIQQLVKILKIPQSEIGKFQSFARGNLSSSIKELEANFPWQANTALPRSNFPTSITSFIGREAELSLIREYIVNANIRLITLTGPPGIGKTRLGLQVMRGSLSHFADGVFFVPLAPLENSSQMTPAIFQALGYIESKNQFTIEQLLKGIADKQMLIMLDNLEHLIEDAALLASRLLSACPRLKILATSRESLRIPGEWIFPVPALDFPQETKSIDLGNLSDFSALTLFAERARAVNLGFSLNPENLQAVASICARLEGVPLAIELIASRVRFMAPQRLLEQMDEQFILSADGRRAVPARQKTLHNAIQWSYSLLPSEEKELLMRLSVFSGGFTMDAAEAIFEDVPKKKSITDLVGSLLDKSLIQRSLAEYGVSRFSMLMMIRDFALDHLRKAGKESVIRAKHLAYFLNLAEQADQHIHGPDQIAWMEKIERNHNNFQTALDWSVTNQYTEFAVRLLGALAWTWWIRCHYSELHGWLDRIRALPRVYDHPAPYAKLLNYVAAQCSDVSESRDAQSMLEESRQIWLTLGENGELGLADCLNWMALEISYSDGALTAAMSLAEQSLAIYRKYNDIWGCAHSLFNAGDIDSRMHRSASSRLSLSKVLLYLSRRVTCGEKVKCIKVWDVHIWI
jgi:predicted ATPase/transcriptional regulator with XRE-family HTH domain